MISVPTGNGGKHHLNVQAYGGLDAMVLPWMPRAWRVKLIARKILRHNNIRVASWTDLLVEAVAPGSFTFSLPEDSHVYEILDARGSTRLFRPISE